MTTRNASYYVPACTSRGTLAASEGRPVNLDEMRNQLMDTDYLLTTTRSIRRLLDVEVPVDPDEIRDCLRIACQAPNGTNMQAWRWVVVSDPELRREIADLYKDSYLAHTAREETSQEAFRPTPFGRIMTSTEWLVDHLSEVPLLVFPCYEPYLEDPGGSSFATATLYGSIFPAV